MQLITQTTMIAEKWIRCDALSIWFDVMRDEKDYRVIEKSITTWYNARKQIETGSVYWHFEFVDEDGVLHELNCRLDMHSLMLKNNFYPKIIQSLLNQ